jgi:transposase-like protein
MKMKDLPEQLIGLATDGGAARLVPASGDGSAVVSGGCGVELGLASSAREKGPTTETPSDCDRCTSGDDGGHGEGHQPVEPSIHRQMSQALERRAEREADRASAFDDRVRTMLTKPSERAGEESTPHDEVSGPADENGADEQSVSRFYREGLATLLDEATGDLIAREDFGHEVDIDFYNEHWFGGHTTESREAIRQEILRKGKHTFHVDDAGKLLDDPDVYRLAVEMGVPITLCVHRAINDDRKLEFILRRQIHQRVCTLEETRKLKNAWIEVQLRLGIDDYETIARKAGVCPNTVRNVETRAAADANSTLGITKKDRRRTLTDQDWEEARRLRSEDASVSDIATRFGVSPATVSKGLRHGEKPKSRRGTAATKPIEDIAARDGVPEVHRRALDRLGLDTQAYIDRLRDRAAESRKELEAVSEVDDVLNLALFYSQGHALADLRLRKLLSGSDEIDVEETVPPGDSRREKAGPDPDTILLGSVMAIESPEVFVALPIGGGVIDNRDNYLDWHATLEVGGVYRVRVEGFDSKRGLWKLTQVGRQTPAPAPGVIAARSDRDDRRSPDTKLAGLKAGPKETGVTK